MPINRHFAVISRVAPERFRTITTPAGGHVGEQGVRVSVEVNQGAFPGVPTEVRLYVAPEVVRTGTTPGSNIWPSFPAHPVPKQPAFGTYPNTAPFELVLAPDQLQLALIGAQGLAVSAGAVGQPPTWLQNEGENALKGVSFASRYFVGRTGPSVLPAFEGHMLRPPVGAPLGQTVLPGHGTVRFLAVVAGTTHKGPDGRWRSSPSLLLSVQGPAGSDVPFSELERVEVVVSRNGKTLGVLPLNIEIRNPIGKGDEGFSPGFGFFTLAVPAEAARALAQNEDLSLQLRVTDKTGQVHDAEAPFVLPARIVEGPPTTGWTIEPFDRPLDHSGG